MRLEALDPSAGAHFAWLLLIGEDERVEEHRRRQKIYERNSGLGEKAFQCCSSLWNDLGSCTALHTLVAEACFFRSKTVKNMFQKLFYLIPDLVSGGGLQLPRRSFWKTNPKGAMTNPLIQHEPCNLRVRPPNAVALFRNEKRSEYASQFPDLKAFAVPVLTTLFISIPSIPYKHSIIYAFHLILFASLHRFPPGVTIFANGSRRSRRSRGTSLGHLGPRFWRSRVWSWMESCQRSTEAGLVCLCQGMVCWDIDRPTKRREL